MNDIDMDDELFLVNEPAAGAGAAVAMDIVQGSNMQDAYKVLDQLQTGAPGIDTADGKDHDRLVRLKKMLRRAPEQVWNDRLFVDKAVQKDITLFKH